MVKNLKEPTSNMDAMSSASFYGKNKSEPVTKQRRLLRSQSRQQKVFSPRPVKKEKPHRQTKAKAEIEKVERKSKPKHEDIETDQSSGYSSAISSPKIKEEPLQGLSEFERTALRNKELRMKMLVDMGIMDAKFSLEASTPQRTMTIKTPKRSYIKKTVTLEPTRRSARLTMTTPDYKELPTIPNQNMAKPHITQLPERKKSEPCSLSDFYPFENNNCGEDVLKSMIIEECDNNDTIWNDDESKMKNLLSSLKCTEETIAKLVTSRICSLLFHPTTMKALLFAGSSQGDFGIWNMSDSKSDPEYYKLHTNCIYCITMDKYSDTTLYTSSYDGTLRKLHLNSAITEEVYGSKEDPLYSCHSQIDAASMLLSGGKQCIDHVDLRSPKLVRSYKVGLSRTKSVQVHPVNTNYFATASADGCIYMWDIRSVKNVVSSYTHSRSVSSLEFSPVTGKYLLSTSWDDTVKITQTDKDFTLKVTSQIRHYNNTGRWLTPFRATWVPNQETLFSIGSLLQPRRIQLFNVKSNNVVNICSDAVNSVNSIVTFHPHKPVMAGGNSSGKVHVFQ